MSIICEFICMGESDDPDLVSACLPPSYVPDEAIRVECYRQLSLLPNTAALDKYGEELQDRFGPRPECVNNLLTLTALKLNCSKAGIHALSVRGDRVLLEDKNGMVRVNGKAPELQSEAALDRLHELCDIVAAL